MFDYYFKITLNNSLVICRDAKTKFVTKLKQFVSNGIIREKYYKLDYYNQDGHRLSVGDEVAKIYVSGETYIVSNFRPIIQSSVGVNADQAEPSVKGYIGEEVVEVCIARKEIDSLISKILGEE